MFDCEECKDVFFKISSYNNGGLDVENVKVALEKYGVEKHIDKFNEDIATSLKKVYASSGRTKKNHKAEIKPIDNSGEAE